MKTPRDGGEKSPKESLPPRFNFWGKRIEAMWVTASTRCLGFRNQSSNGVDLLILECCTLERCGPLSSMPWLGNLSLDESSVN